MKVWCLSTPPLPFLRVFSFHLSPPHKSKCHRIWCCNVNNLLFLRKKIPSFVILNCQTNLGYIELCQVFSCTSLSWEATFFFRSIFCSISWMIFSMEEKQYLNAPSRKCIFMEEKSSDEQPKGKACRDTWNNFLQWLMLFPSCSAFKQPLTPTQELHHCKSKT